MGVHGTTAPGWYLDPAGLHELRWWDGSTWSAAVIDQGRQAQDPLPPLEDAQATADTSELVGGPLSTEALMPGKARSADGLPLGSRDASGVSPVASVQVDGGAPGVPRSTAIPPLVDEVPDANINLFSAKRIARQLRIENQALRSRGVILEGIAREYGGLEAVQIIERTRDLRAQEQAVQDQLAAAEAVAERERSEARAEILRARNELASIEESIVGARDRVELESRGLFDYEHVAEASAALASELASLRSEIKTANGYDRAIHASTSFTFNNSAAKGKAFVNQMRRIMLRAYNAEAENAVKTVKTGNLAPAQKRLVRAKEQIEKQGTMISLAVDERYHWLRLREIELAARHHEAVAAEKALDRERREELREQRKAEEELRREKQRLEKERSHYLNSIARLRAAGEEAEASKLEAELAKVDAEIAQADYRAANIRAGYVYVISNVGAFGDGVVKIGMTRRLEPMDRVKELGDASVPFTFDVHALFFADDAVGIEAALHREFAARRLNQVNPRKEFFRVRPAEVLEALQKQRVSVLEFRTEVEAEEYRTSQVLLEQKAAVQA